MATPKEQWWRFSKKNKVAEAKNQPTVKVEYVDYVEMLKQKGFVCGICGYPIEYGPGQHHGALSFDHEIPLSKGGSHTWDNIRPAHAFCNYSKGNKLPGEYTPTFNPDQGIESGFFDEELVESPTTSKFNVGRETRRKCDVKQVQSATLNILYTENTSENTYKEGSEENEQEGQAEKGEPSEQTNKDTSLDPFLVGSEKTKDKDGDTQIKKNKGAAAVRVKNTATHECVSGRSKQALGVRSKKQQALQLIEGTGVDVESFIKWRGSKLAATDSYRGVKVSKEVVLQFYAKKITSFGSDLEKAQSLADLDELIKTDVEMSGLNSVSAAKQPWESGSDALFEQVAAVYKTDPLQARKIAGSRWNEFIEKLRGW